jgi:hypothetical protein
MIGGSVGPDSFGGSGPDIDDCFDGSSVSNVCRIISKFEMDIMSQYTQCKMFSTMR